MIAYMTDFQFIGTAPRSIGLNRTSSPQLQMLASLDHTTHFYPLPLDFDPSAPLLHVMESAIIDTGYGRGVVRGLLYTSEGVLVAATMQEGVVRTSAVALADTGPEEKAFVGDVDVDGGKGSRAKL